MTSQDASPVNAAANAARKRKKHDRWAPEMREAGFIVIEPEKVIRRHHFNGIETIQAKK